MSKKIILKKPGEAPQVLDVNIQYRCELKQYTGGYTETCLLRSVLESNLVFACNEEGHPLGLPFNCYAVTTSAHFPIQMLVGNIVFTKLLTPENPYEELYDYEIGSLNDDEIKEIFEILKDENQKDYSHMFHNRYKEMSEYLSPVIMEIGEL